MCTLHRNERPPPIGYSEGRQVTVSSYGVVRRGLSRAVLRTFGTQHAWERTMVEHKHVEFLPEYNVAVCCGCHIGVRLEHMKSHFAAGPHRLGKGERDELFETVSKLFQDARGVGDGDGDEAMSASSSVPRWPPATSPPIEALGLPLTGGFRCTFASISNGIGGGGGGAGVASGNNEEEAECAYVTGSRKAIEIHCRLCHGWKSARGRGRPRRHGREITGQPGNPWRCGVSYQRFFAQGPNSGFFEVNRGRDGSNQPGTGNDSRPSGQGEDAFDRLLGRMQERRQELEEAERSQLLAVDDTKEPDPWRRRVGVGRYLKRAEEELELELAQLRDLAQRPIDAIAPDGGPGEESHIVEVHHAFRRLIWSARSNAILEKVGIFALFEVERRSSGQESNRPFNAYIRRATVRRYRHVWNGIWTFVLRTWQLPAKERPPFTITQDQRRLLFNVLEEAERVAGARPRKPKSRASVAGAGLTDRGGPIPTTAALSFKELRVRLEDAVLNLVIGLLDHALSDDAYESILISALAVLSIEADGSFGDLEDFLPRVSAVIKFARLLVVQKAHRSRAQDIAKEARAGGLSEEDAAAITPGHTKRVTDMVYRFMVRLPRSKREPRPIDWLLSLRTYGLRIQYTTPIEGQVYWVGDVLHYRSIRFSMDSLRGFVRGLVSDMRRLLFDHLLLADDDGVKGIVGDDAAPRGIPRVDWSWVDNPTEKSVGWSFLKDIRNRFEVDGTQWLARRILGNRKLCKKFVRKEHGEVHWVRKAMDQYVRFTNRFLEKLLLAMHFTGGGPARVPEIMSLRHRNTANGGVRNIFIDQGLVVFVTMYHKNYERSGKLRPIQRFIPREVGEPLLLFLWLAVPFLEATQAVMKGDSNGPLSPPSAFLWGDRSLVGADEAGSSESSSGEDEVDGDGDGGEAGTNGTESEHQQATPSARPRQPVKRRGKKRRGRSTRWTPDLMRRLVKQETERLMKVKVGVSAWRQIAPAIPRRYLRTGFNPDLYGREDQEISHEDEYEDEYEAAPARDSPWDEQTGHRSFTAGMVYGRLISEAEFESMDTRARFRAVSEDWHRFLQFPSSIGDIGPIVIGRKRRAPSYWVAASKEIGLERWKHLADTNIQARLQELIGADAQFRGVQERAIRAIMRGTNPIVVIMGTGAGKSLCFMLPASCALGGTTIVVVPLTSLQGNLQGRCEESGIPSIVWTSRRPHDTAAIIFVTPEAALGETFAGLLTRLVASHQLDRIVVDECHVVLDGKKDFRPMLRKLGDLALRGIQMVYLTATLPPRDEAEFFRLMYIDEGMVTKFRSKTTRKNVRYQVLELDLPPPVYDALGRVREDSLETALVELVEQKIEQYAEPAKIVIYCGTIDIAKRLAARLGCSLYHHDVGTASEKLQLLEDWVKGRGPGHSQVSRRVMVASNALGLGINVGDIRVVFHIGWLRKLKDYGQESGRAGRDGLPSEAIVIRRRDDSHNSARRRGSRVGLPGDAPGLNETLEESGLASTSYHKGRQFPDIDEYVGGQWCRRKVLDMVMDGRHNRAGCEHDEERCDVCDRWMAYGHVDKEEDTAAGVESEVLAAQNSTQLYGHMLRERVGQKRADAVENVERLCDYLELWAGKCGLCWWLGQESEDHSIWGCAAENAELVRHGIDVMHQELRKWKPMEDFSGCFGCLLPYSLCNRWQSRGDAGGWVLVDDGDSDSSCDAAASCEFGGVVITALAAVWVAYHEQVTPTIYGWMRQDGVDEKNLRQRYRWFGERVRWGEVESNRLCDVLLHVGGEVAGGRFKL